MSSLMAGFAQLGIRTRLMAGFSAVLALMVILTAVGVTQVSRIDSGLTQINDVNGDKSRQAIDWRGSVHDRAILLRDITLVEAPAALDNLLGDYQALADDYRQASQQMTAVMAENAQPNATEDTLLSTIESQENQTNALAEAVIERRLSGDLEGARELLLNQAGPAFFQWLADINAFLDFQEAQSDTSTALARDTASGFQMLMVGLCLMALLAGGLIAFLLSRQLLGELGAEPSEVRAFAHAIGRGKLTTHGRLRKGDTRSIMAAQVEMARHLQGIVAQVRAASEAVASNSEQIAEGSNELATRSEQQASSLTETAAAMEQLTGTVAQNADNAQRASHEANSTAMTAERGGIAVRGVADAMNGLDKSSREIASIISTIDSIAFQTNILALNASVEAARAGEHGRGFAVVAAEVRKLAQSSASAAKEITALVTTNAQRVKDGNDQASQADQATQDVLAAIGRVNEIMQQISQASAEQRQGVQEAGQAVAEMDQVTQQNVSVVGESRNAAGNLRHHARQLLSAMSAFELPDNHFPDGTHQTSAGVVAMAESEQRRATEPSGKSARQLGWQSA
ncbi:methyl-accepting chemotaxis protein [Halomonas urumqiensis]|uniref:Methyl-accepting chemotaxis protein n=1 Tax=Halomonas urumqiensis TaxID=1684789 RepID=A0A2N7UGA0_9GAMM|nr:methyl-accepting chemotaxis protein [Halomonas urumqiensis]PMR79442.1 methyl-accepting chemotaxis protein [Halomonas urumqiensis]PTB01435.1 methyl-accepting chemotaxis protein [Halomonas urumqiensis]GHE22475.1 methyl-accepting chemotaxis protein [Halomonas urumqiensis]